MNRRTVGVDAPKMEPKPPRGILLPAQMISRRPDDQRLIWVTSDRIRLIFEIGDTKPRLSSEEHEIDNLAVGELTAKYQSQVSARDGERWTFQFDVTGATREGVGVPSVGLGFFDNQYTNLRCFVLPDNILPAPLGSGFVETTGTQATIIDTLRRQLEEQLSGHKSKSGSAFEIATQIVVRTSRIRSLKLNEFHLWKKIQPLNLEKWEGRNRFKKETSIQFIRRVYGRWLARLSRADLFKLDQPLYMAHATWVKRHGDPLNLPNRSVIADREFSGLEITKPAEAYGRIPKDQRKDPDMRKKAAREYSAARRALGRANLRRRNKPEQSTN
jgi:hypothetical protein